MDFLEGEDHARQGCVEGRCQAGGSTARNQVAFLHARAAEKAAHALGRHGAELDGRALASEGEARAEADDPAGQLHVQDAEPVEPHEAQNDALDLGNAGAPRHGLVLREHVEHVCHGKEHGEPRPRVPIRPARQVIVEQDAQHFRLRQGPAEEADDEARENTHHDAFPEQLDLEIVPVRQGLVGLADARIRLFVAVHVQETAAQTGQERLFLFRFLRLHNENPL